MGRAARTSIRRPHGSSIAGQYVDRGGDYNLYRPKDAGGARPCRICQHHPPRPRDYLGTLCLSRPGFCFGPPKYFLAFNSFRTSCLVSVSNRHIRLQTSTGWRSRCLQACFGAASATSRLPNVSVFAMLLQFCDKDHRADRSRRIIVETSWVLLSVQHESLYPETAIVCGLRKGKDRV